MPATLTDIFHDLLTQAKNAPYLTAFTACSIILLYTRLKSGYLKWKHENEIDAPSKPIPILPYWIPYLGHGPEFGWSFDDLLTRGRKKTKDGIFGLTMLGSQHYMVLMPSLAKEFFLQRPNVLSGDEFLFWLHDKYFGDGGAAKAFPPEDFRTLHRTLNTLMREPFLSIAANKLVQLVEEKTPSLLSVSHSPEKQHLWESAAQAEIRGDEVEVELFELTINFVGDLAGEVMTGKAFLENNPHVLPDLFEFDSGFNALLTGIPHLTPGLAKALSARTRLNAAFAEWNKAMRAYLNNEDLEYKWQDLSDVSETMKVRIQTLQNIHSSEEFTTVSSVALYWALMINANKIIFWMLYSIISSPPLLSSILDEINPFASLSQDGKLSIDLEGLRSCQLFKATFFETLRVYTAGTSYKKVLQPLTLTESPEDAVLFSKPRPQSYHIPAGSFLVIPHATMQMDPRVWSEPKKFDPERFLVDGERGKEAAVRHLNAFGGGHTICKGRYFAEREVITFVAGLLVSWEFMPITGQWLVPRKRYNGTGSASPKEQVRVRMRRKW